jgi:hypothetical protein
MFVEDPVPKLVTVWREEDVLTQAKHYVRSYILFPSGILGLICMIGGVGGLGYQFIASDTYTWGTFTASSGLLLLGVACGWVQTRYHRYLLETVPHVFAARMRSVVQRRKKKSKVDSKELEIEHPGRALISFAYLCGAALLVAGSFLAFTKGSVDAVPAFLMPWAGFYWGKLFFWRGVIR